ncbi:MAG: hypothetical protein U9N61_10910 [Euryarchaeota archaeon]|nr:hypothetical protein [Euryarchaeota archaeon]
MEPLRTCFPRLKESQVDLLVESILSGGDPESCAICNKLLFNSQDCSECPFKGKCIKDILIESFIPLAMSIAKRLGGYGYKEVIDEALLALTEAINCIPSDIRSVEAYVRVRVTQRLKKFLILDTTIRVPEYGLATHQHLRTTYQIDGNVSSPGEQEVVEINELLARVPKNKNEEIILKCITEGGYSLRDMSDKCRVHESRVSQIKQLLLERIMLTLRKEGV